RRFRFSPPAVAPRLSHRPRNPAGAGGWDGRTSSAWDADLRRWFRTGRFAGGFRGGVGGRDGRPPAGSPPPTPVGPQACADDVGLTSRSPSISVFATRRRAAIVPSPAKPDRRGWA